MFGFSPAPGEVSSFPPEGTYEQLPRTKDRAYKVAVWGGINGAHEFFLGRTVRGVVWLCCGIGAAVAALVLGVMGVSWWWALPLVAWLLSWPVAVWQVARMDADDPVFSGVVDTATMRRVAWMNVFNRDWMLDWWRHGDRFGTVGQGSSAQGSSTQGSATQVSAPQVSGPQVPGAQMPGAPRGGAAGETAPRDEASQR